MYTYVYTYVYIQTRTLKVVGSNPNQSSTFFALGFESFLCLSQVLEYLSRVLIAVAY